MSTPPAITALAAQIRAAIPEPPRCPQCGTVVRIGWRRHESRQHGKNMWAGYHGATATRPEPCIWDRRFWPTADTEAAAAAHVRNDPPR